MTASGRQGKKKHQQHQTSSTAKQNVVARNRLELNIAKRDTTSNTIDFENIETAGKELSINIGNVYDKKTDIKMAHQWRTLLNSILDQDRKAVPPAQDLPNRSILTHTNLKDFIQDIKKNIIRYLGTKKKNRQKKRIFIFMKSSALFIIS